MMLQTDPTSYSIGETKINDLEETIKKKFRKKVTCLQTSFSRRSLHTSHHFVPTKASGGVSSWNWPWPELVCVNIRYYLVE